MPGQRRSRDYQALYAARNSRAQARGFKSYGELRRLRASGQLPSAREVATNPQAARRFAEYSRARRAGFTDPSERRRSQRDTRERQQAQRWSDDHSLQPVSRYRPDMSESEFRAYYRALVQPWGHVRTDADRRALRTWIVDMTAHLTKEEYDDDPRY